MNILYPTPAIGTQSKPQNAEATPTLARKLKIGPHIIQAIPSEQGGGMLPTSASSYLQSSEKVTFCYIVHVTLITRKGWEGRYSKISLEMGDGGDFHGTWKMESLHLTYMLTEKLKAGMHIAQDTYYFQSLKMGHFPPSSQNIGYRSKHSSTPHIRDRIWGWESF